MMFYLKYLLKLLRKLIYIQELVFFKFKHPNIPIIQPNRIGSYYSQDGQDLLLSSLLFDIIKQEKKNLWIVDIGCNHPLKYSNSFFFEKYFSIRVLAIDAIQEFESIFSVMRPKAKFVASAVGKDSGVVELNIPSDPVFADNMFSFVEGGFNKKPKMIFKKRTVKLTKLADLITTEGGGHIKEILFISIDIEGSELSALKGINFEDVKIYCIICENNSTSLFGSEDIREFLKQKGFQFCFSIGNLDDVFINTLFFEEYGCSFRLKVN